MCSSIASSSSSGAPANSATTSAVRSSAVGPSPPEVTTRATPRGEEVERAREVVRPVADDHDVRDLDPERASRWRQPRAVAVARSTPVSTSVPVTTMPARPLTWRRAPCGPPP